ncbi:MAG: prolyl aminopeptidase [Pseudomonadota bacterium]
MAAPCPPPEPFETGILDTGEGHRIYWERCGTPGGRPAVALHGGPGSGASPRLRRLFDPERYCLTLFDQRGCGRSRPHAAETLAALEANTTRHLIADIERLRARFGLARWLVFGGSWGATLALAYARAHPSAVAALVLAGVTTTSRAEIEWLYGGAGARRPEAFAAFRAAAPEAEPGLALVAAYARRLQDPDPGTHRAAAAAWCAWEQALAEPDPATPPSPRWSDPAFRLAFARLVTHYFGHLAWLAAAPILPPDPGLAAIPAWLVQSRGDLAAPAATAEALHAALPLSRLALLDGTVHAASGRGMAEATTAATGAALRDPSLRW